MKNAKEKTGCLFGFFFVFFFFWQKTQCELAQALGFSSLSLFTPILSKIQTAA